ncbi:MAG: hypothetical protein A3J65_03820 [Candidatus Buchananbacteria bacterium RIFCSPHIGHO2_02_FULL_45_11b]|uniref:Uncharacterized protein n=4 Tax=Candidatus Buchananiibacteriota TaxID=1817903 RepID=A0A1G1Y8X9_9BACT|nr:MAG: hypothetical protein A2663_01460 [Candidatus Buchananbacteria bacterium RIFCSPHIGHO2_01_FULL_46_12]OGY51751.1 MAG: hypothetical protein A3J65_03820 [Candidatus Buchananbacteria bacterium RIFCSPHIGHO2_02_FULL_45_11b]OGY52985.1 MAG: hypothetical protein A3B15_03015 [Candidatus Buchananbacteria bacterium RIFCSPLOWO2_01_FULL_45_31]OGY56442.1 MAG: hypothetical protein A3H67_05225 [Candidatus Buchananbacteria bacterium RIFCSPLOWO2_02_FULL_46_11b]
MGKHERESIEEAEKIIVKLLNNESLSKSDLKNHWLEHTRSIAKKIKKDFSDITSVRHLGNDYATIGDISFMYYGQEIIVEAKMSDKKSGRGTKANISQNALTENKLFGGGVDSWSEFRNKKRHDLWVMKYLDEFKEYPENLPQDKENKARYLRKFKKKNKKAAEILNEIQKRDRREKEEYLLYLSKQKQIPENIRRFLSLIILGIHKKEKISALIRSDDFIFKAQKLILYYGNLSDKKIIVSSEDVGSSLKKILSKFKYFKINFSPDVTCCKLVGVDSKGNNVTLLQIVLHWKNIAQGIKTPCLNIFD